MSNACQSNHHPSPAIHSPNKEHKNSRSRHACRHSICPTTVQNNEPTESCCLPFDMNENIESLECLPANACPQNVLGVAQTGRNVYANRVVMAGEVGGGGGGGQVGMYVHRQNRTHTMNYKTIMLVYKWIYVAQGIYACLG